MRHIIIFFTLSIIGLKCIPAQEKTTPNRFGLVLGYPNIIGIDYEYNFNSIQRISITSSLFYFKYDKNNDFTETGNFNIGSRFYLTKNTKGFYSGLDIGYAYFINKSSNLVFTDSTTTYERGSSKTDINAIIIHPNIGYRAIKNHFTITPQIGIDLIETLKYSYKEEAEGYLYEKTIDDLDSKFRVGTLTLYLSIGIAF